MKIRSLLLAAFASFVTTLAVATPQSHDGNDLWVVPGELGWGINIFHQGDTLFASLFVYGPDGKARWYTGSSLIGDDGGPLQDRPAVYSGALYESTGPAVGAAFDPSRVTRRQVGTMSVELGREKLGASNPIRNYAMVSYEIDGVRVVMRQAYPFSFVAMGLTGSYTGYESSSAGPTETNFNVTLNNGSFAMTTTAAGKTCTYSGTQETNGSLFAVEGTRSCSDGASGSFEWGDVDVTRHGFTAGGSQGNIAAQRTSSAIRGDGYNTDLWLNPSESGWGLNLIEQGDILFGTLFVYDSQGQPRWYSASNLAYEQCAPADGASDCNARYRGALYESSGPYFGTSFNPAAVQRRQVGTMTLDMFGNNTAYVDYTIDGVGVTRKPLQRFTFRANAMSGSYAAHMLAIQGQSNRGVQTGAMKIDVSESGSAITVAMRGAQGTCTMRGTRSQYGRQVAASGSYDCGGAPIGRLELSDVYVTSSGFTGSFSLDGSLVGRIDATRTN